VNRIWIDVDDLFKFASSGQRPSGIQRLEFELCFALSALPESKGRVFFVKHDSLRQRLVTTSWETVEAVYGVLSGASEIRKVSPVMGRVRFAVKAAVRALPSDLRRLALLQIEVLIGLIELARARASDVAGAFRRRWRFRKSRAVAPQTGDYFADAAQPGDVLAVLGAGWVDFALCERAAQEKGLRLALLIYDIIALRRSEWFERHLVEVFRTWFEAAVPQADAVLTISAATARDVTAYAGRAGLKLRAVPKPIPIGTGFSKVAARESAGPVEPNRLPAPNSYVLVVSTIEVRKNHLLLFRVWRRLLEEMPAEEVPTLVFAGQTGWIVTDLMEQLRSSRFLDGKIVHVESPSDRELEALYDGCLFTLFPSFYEGWGLPVTESHAFGRPCIVSRTTSLPEAGGALARYIDPENTTEAYHVIRETIEDRAGLSQWRERVQREFRPVAWSESARAVLQALDEEVDAGATKLRWSA
jgi:glycosyltransferase involved in cell wall biosynthesis